MIELWTDGSGNTNAKPGGWAFVLVAYNDGGKEVGRKEVFGGVSLFGSNNRMELSAVLFGLRAITRKSHVKVCTDSEYVARAFPEGWLDKWDRDGWDRVKNADLWHDLRVAVGWHHSVEWHHVEGHSGIELNERCDALAGEARKAMVRLLEGASDGES